MNNIGIERNWVKEMLREIAIILSVIFCSIVAHMTDGWNIMLLYWAIRIHVDLVWRDK
jgi:hypothetical protein